MNTLLTEVRTDSTKAQVVPCRDHVPHDGSPGVLTLLVSDVHGLVLETQMPIWNCVGRPVREMVDGAIGAHDASPRTARLSEVLARTATGAAAIIAGGTQLGADAVVTVEPGEEEARYTLDLTVVPIHVGGGEA